MPITIKNRWTGDAIVTVEDADSIREAVIRLARQGISLQGAELTAVRDDLFAVLSSAPSEVPALIAALEEGKVDGSTYTGDCACLVGTIANARHCGINDIPGLSPDSFRPAEVWFLSIKPGHTPENSLPAKLAHQWASDWLSRMRAAFATPANHEGGDER